MDEDMGETGNPTIIEELEYSRPDTFDDLIAGIPMDVDEDASSHGLHVPPRIALSKDRPYSGLSTGLNTLETWKEQFEEGNATHERFSQWKVLFLNSESRLTACDTTEFENEPFLGTAGTLHHALLEDDSGKEEQFRDAFKETFGMDIALDYSGMKELCFRIATDFDDLPDHPRELHAVIHDYPKLDDQGEGFRSFASIVLSLLFSEGRVVLLDEPEAFLHPEQARTLGNWIAEHSESIPGQVLLATHNSNILSGILNRTQEVTICRLSRSEDSTSYYRMPEEVVSELGKDPLLSSQEILRGIFHRGVVVCEGDSDSTVYRSVAVNQLNNSDLLFVHAHDKTRIDRVVGALSRGNVPVVGIADIDVLKGDDFEDIIRAMNPELEPESLFRLRRTVDEEIREADSGWSAVKNGGLSNSPTEVREDLEDLLDEAREHGLFIVPVGELEDWFGIGKNKSASDKVVDALEKIDDGTADSRLIEFIENIDQYLSEEYGRL